MPVTILSPGDAYVDDGWRNRRNTARAPILIDLFCGAGGLSDGLHQAGFRPVMAVDMDQHAAGTYRLNNPDTEVVQGDVAKLTGRDALAAAGGREVDLIAGGPSCQGYSTHGKRIEEDPRNFLFKHFVRMVSEVQPKFFLMENVRGLLTFRGGYFGQLIKEAFDRIGYRVVSQVICAADYGVPQLRHRIVFLGTRTDVPLSMPVPTHGFDGGLWDARVPHVTFGEATSDLPLLRGKLRQESWSYLHEPANDFQRYVRPDPSVETVDLHQASGMSDAAREVVRLVREGQGLRHVPPDLLPDRFKKMRRLKDGSLRKDCTTLFFRPSRERPSYTITCYFRNVASGPFVHPVEDRSLSFREATRLMSFRDSYRFQGANLARQIGNAVPPLMARALGVHLRSMLATLEKKRVPTEKPSRKRAEVLV